MRESGTSLITVIAVVLIILKLLSVIKWSWWVVLAPLYLFPILFVLGFWLFGMVAIIVAFIKNKKRG